MNYDDAWEYVRAHSDGDDGVQEVDEVFEALFGRWPDEQDRSEGLWSHCVSLVIDEGLSVNSSERGRG